ncbi:MAG TPA: hypothetical protein VG346_12905 [Acidimicrobiales bacterium]|nr:hypothetical protein [Acidimicrobiales bacterium]
MTIAIATRGRGLATPGVADVPVVAGGGGGKRRRRKLRRILLATGAGLVALIALVAAWIGISLYKIDHAVHHVGIPAALLAKGKNDLLAIVMGPDRSEQIFVFHATAGHTNVLKIPSSLGLPLAGGRTAPIQTLSLHAPDAIIGGLAHLGIPVTHYVGVDLHMVDPSSNLGQLATGKLSITSMISDPTSTTTLLEQVASHIYLGPGTPVSAVLSLMNVPTAHPVSVPTSKDVHGRVVLASAFTTVLRSFL